MTTVPEVKELTQETVVRYGEEVPQPAPIAVKKHTVPMAKINKVSDLIDNLSQRFIKKLEESFGKAVLEPCSLFFPHKNRQGEQKVFVVIYTSQTKDLYMRAGGYEGTHVDQYLSVEEFIGMCRNMEFDEETIDAAIKGLERQKELCRLYPLIEPVRKYYYLWRQIFTDYGKKLDITQEPWASIPRGFIFLNRNGTVTAIAFHDWLRVPVMEDAKKLLAPNATPPAFINAIGDNSKEEKYWIPTLKNSDTTNVASTLSSLTLSYDGIVKNLPPRPAKPFNANVDRHLIQKASDFVKLLYTVKTHLSIEDNEHAELLARKLIAVQNEMGIPSEQEVAQGLARSPRTTTQRMMSNKPPLFKVPTTPFVGRPQDAVADAKPKPEVEAIASKIDVAGSSNPAPEIAGKSQSELAWEERMKKGSNK